MTWDGEGVSIVIVQHARDVGWCRLEEDEEELDRLQALMEEEDGGARGVAIHTKSYSLVLYRALQKGLLLECSARVQHARLLRRDGGGGGGKAGEGGEEGGEEGGRRAGAGVGREQGGGAHAG
eukprot:3571758-Rhodomonas_salina.2